MTNLKLNISVSNNGGLMCDIYVVSAVNPETSQRETLRYFTNKDRAVSTLKFWQDQMNYTDGRIDWKILHLD